MTTSGRRVSGTRVVDATPEAIFAILADPRKHPLLDGSGSVRSPRGAIPDRLALGSRFSMNMHLIAPYRIANKVVEFEENRVIAWCHLGGHRWRWELEPVEGGTRVTETFDWSTARFPPGIALMRAPERNKVSIEASLSRLEDLLRT